MGDSVQVAPLVVTKQGGFFSWLPTWQGAALLLLTVSLYASVLVRLVLQWLKDPNASHGFFVPAFALFVLWKNRHELKRIGPAPSWWGISIIAVAVVTLALGALGAELFLARVSFLFLLAGLIILFHGWPFFRAVLFPWAFLILMIPIPNLVFQKVTFPLQILASQLATAVLHFPLFNVPVLREGNLIKLPAMTLEVVEACSGIRSLLSLVTLAIIYGYLMDNRKWVRVVLTISAIPIAVAANSFRIVGTGLLVQYWPERAEGFLHTFQGLSIFVVSLAILFSLHALICRIWKNPPEEKRRADASAAITNDERRPGVHALTKAPWLRFVMAAALMAGTSVLLEARSQNEVIPARQPLSSLPMQLGGWTGQDASISQEQLDILGAGEFLQRDFDSAVNAQPEINLFIAYFPSQRTGDTIHSPSHCLPGSGWVPTKQREVVQLPRPDGSRFPANRYVVSKAGDRELVIYWYQAHSRAVASEYSSKYYLVADSIRMRRSDGALIRLITPMSDGESMEAAQARLWSLGSQLVPLLDSYIPR